MMDKRGFTLIEIIVSVGIFTVVMLAGIGAIISINGVSRRSQKVKITMDNLNFALEGMTRELRLGKTYDCDINSGNSDAPTPQDCSLDGANSIAFRDNEGQLIKYKLNTGLGRIQKFDPRLNGTDFVDVTSPDVTISSLLFYVSGTAFGDDAQPRILIGVSGTVEGDTPQSSTDFRMQTSVTQRPVDTP